VHGLRSDQVGYAERAAACARAGIASITFDLGGHGESDGELDRLSLPDHVRDLLAAYDEVAGDDAVDAARIGFCGASYGAYLAARAVSERRVRRLLLRAPALYAEPDPEAPIGRLRGTTAPAEAADVLGGLSRYDGRVLIVESGRDEVIPHAVVEAYRSVLPHASYRLMPDATHSLVEAEWRREFLDLILTWFEAL
jgi:pimeloyl-ACP methyl ester carboxylesterase